MSFVVAGAGLLPGAVDAFVPLALFTVLVLLQVRRAADGPGAERAPDRLDRAVAPLAVLFAIVLVLQIAKLL